MSATLRRTIPPLVDDPRAVHLTLAQRHTLALLPLALDDHGRTLDDPGRINGVLWGSLWREHGPDDLDADLSALAEAGLVTRYEVDGVACLQMLDWDSQQVVSRRGASRYPPPPGGTRSRTYGRPGPFAAGDAGEKVWQSVDGLVDYMAGASEKLHDPAVQARAVSFLADIAGQIDPNLSGKVRERAGTWLGSAAYDRPGAAADAAPPADGDVWVEATAQDAARLDDDKPGPTREEN